MAEANDGGLDSFTSGVTNQYVDDARADGLRSSDAGSRTPDAGTAQASTPKVSIDSPMFGPALPLAFAPDTQLQAALKRAVDAKKEYLRLGIALVDLTATTAGKPGRYAESRGDSSIPLDSIAKLAPMYAAYQLRHDLNAYTQQAAPADADSLTSGFIGVLKSGRAEPVRAVARKPPKFDAIFDLTQPRRIAFSERFGDALRGGLLRDMLQYSDDIAASRCIAYLGFDWINALLGQAGLAAMSARGAPNGFYLGKLYSSLSSDADPYLKSHPYYWDAARKTETQYGSAKAVAQLLAQIATGRLVDAASSSEMTDLMLDPKDLSYFGQGLDAMLGTRSPKIRSKVGYLPSEKRASDCAIVERMTMDRNVIRYVAVGLGAAFESNGSNQVLASLIKDLDACVVARNGFKE